MKVATLDLVTTIVGYEYQHGCVIAADAQTTADGWAFTHPDLRKIVTRNGYLIAASGEGQPCDIAAQLWTPPARGKHTTWYEHGVRILSPSLRVAHEKAGYTPSKDDDWSVMIAHSGQILTIESDYSVLRSHNGIYGSGSGSSYAIGALTALLPTTPINDAIAQAIHTAAMYDVYTSAPVQVETQKKEAALG